MKKTTILLLLLICCIYSYAQQATVKGVITDTLSKQNLHHAVISLLHSNDSTLYTFSRSDEKGGFEMKNLKPGKYVVLVSYPTYADYFDTLSLSENSNIDLGKVMLTTKAHLLSDVTVRQRIAAVRMRGDTIVYKADSFKVKEGASVEELLKKFPGIQVDKNGNITAMGTKVEKVLVDGEEFFGDDPTIATKNLSASMVNEVQVFDKKSDQAAFTGVDDGQTTRTINLKLKDDAKKGWFGKVEAGAGPDDKWNNTAMANSFKNKRKLSFYGIASSTGKTGLDWDESGKFGGGENSNMTVNDDGGVYMTWGGGGNDFDNANYWGEGIPKSWSAGLNFGDKYNNDKQSVNGSYRYGKIINEGQSHTTTQSIVPDTTFITNEESNVYGNKDRHAMNGSLDWLIDSLFSAKVTLKGTIGNMQGSSKYIAETTDGVGNLSNRSYRTTSTTNDNNSFASSILLRKKFKKVGRTLSFNFDQNWNKITSDGYLYAVLDFYNKSGLTSSDTTDQRKNTVSNNNSINTRLTYTEQLVKNLIVELSYGYNLNKYENKVLSFDKSADGKYDLLNTTYSNDYDFSVATHKVGTVFRYNSKKITAYAGGDVGFADYTQKDLLIFKDSVTTYNYTNFFPRANFTYKFNANKRISLTYNGNTRQPTMQQIQPVADNNNPLFVQLGNADLKQEFNHRLNLNLNSWQVLKNRGYWAGANFNFTTDAISSSRMVNYSDSAGKTTTQFINVNGNYGLSGYIGYNMKLQKLDMYFNTNLSGNQNIYRSYENNVKNETKSRNIQINMSVSKEKEKVYNFWVYLNGAYNTSTSSINPDINSDYWSIGSGGDLTYQLPWKLEINNNLEVNVRQKTPLFPTNNNSVVWNAYLAKKFLKGDKGQIRFSAFDLFNQNIGITRNISSTKLVEKTYTQLARYFLLSFIWNFSKGGATLNK